MKKWQVATTIAMVVAYAFLGWFTGYMIGVSTAPIVGAIVPVALGAFLGAIQAARGNRTDIEQFYLAVGVILFGVFCLWGTRFGADARREALEPGYAPPLLADESALETDSAKAGDSPESTASEKADDLDPPQLKKKIASFTNLIDRWKIYLYAQRLNLTKAEYEGLIQLLEKDNRLEAGKWDNFEEWLNKFAASGQLRGIKEEADVLGGRNKESSNGDGPDSGS